MINHNFQKISNSVFEINEDEVEFHKNEGWILDGATSISGRRCFIEGRLETDASWFVRTFSEGLCNRPLEKSVEAWAGIILENLQDGAHLHWNDWSNIDVPSASFSHISLTSNSAVFLNLGDCRILYQVDAGSISSFGNSGVQKFDQALLEAYVGIRREAPTLGHQQAWERLVPNIRANRQLMNLQNGYWILSPDGKGLSYLQRLEIHFSHQLRATLVSDGLFRLVDTYFKMSVEEFFEHVFEPDGLAALIYELRSIEAVDSDAVRYPRVKLQDDASALLVTSRKICSVHS